MLRKFGRLVRALLKTVFILAFTGTVVPFVMVAVSLAIVLFTPVPITIPAKKVLPAQQASYVYDSTGNLLTIFRKVESNIPIQKSDIPRVLKQAIVAAEDRRFYTHNGVDAIGLVRAVKRDLEANEAEQGASTITQQLVKIVYYPDDDRTDVFEESASTVKRNANRLWRKLRIAVIANRLDRKKSKDDILFEYMSNIFLGNGANGVGAAAQTYFRKGVKDLSISEAATIAGIIPAPSKYEPRGNTSNAEFKRKTTLAQMRREGYITELQYEDAVAQELWTEEQGPPPVGKRVTFVYSPPQYNTKYPYFVDYVRRYLVSKYGEATLYSGGLTIRTTLDPKMQDDAEATAASALKGTKPNLEMSIVSVEPLTGFVKALVGGRDFYAVGGQVNLGLGDCPTPESLRRLLKGRDPKLAPACNGRDYVDGGGSGRSPGSSFKPVVLAAAFNRGIPPDQVLSGARYKDPRCKRPVKGCVINNYEGASYGDVDLRTATIKSVNTSYARLGYDIVGIENVAKMAQRLGITSAWYDPARHGPSYSLGGLDVSPLEMAAAYSVFAGRGKRAPATPIQSIVDATGKVLEDNATTQPKQVISQEVADNVTSVLQGVVTSGTGKRAALGDRPVAGKTGTSQGYGNAWFVGYTPTLSTAVWIGYKDRPRPLINIKGVGRVAGGTIPSATFSKYMRLVLKGVPPTQFDEAAPIKRPKKVNPVEEVKRRARLGIDPGPRRAIATTSNPSYGAKPTPPKVTPPAQPSPVANTAVTNVEGGSVVDPTPVEPVVPATPTVPPTPIVPLTTAPAAVVAPTQPAPPVVQAPAFRGE